MEQKKKQIAKSNGTLSIQVSGSLADLLHFDVVNFENLRKSRVDSFLMLSNSQTKDVSWTCFVFNAIYYLIQKLRKWCRIA